MNRPWATIHTKMSCRNEKEWRGGGEERGDALVLQATF